MVVGLRGLKSKLAEMQSYIDLVVAGKLPVNNEIMRNLQDSFNLLPNLNVAELSRSFAVESNDMMMVVYLASLIRSVIALHNLMLNREERKQKEKEDKEKEKAAAEASKKENEEKEKEAAAAKEEGKDGERELQPLAQRMRSTANHDRTK